MANTTSGTVTFDKTFAVDDLIAEAYERIGSQVSSGNQLRSARRSLNILFQEWGNRGLHYWEVAESNIDLIEGQTEYTFYRASKFKNNYEKFKKLIFFVVLVLIIISETSLRYSTTSSIFMFLYFLIPFALFLTFYLFSYF